MPSLKYSFSGSPLRFTNGKTARRFAGGFVFPFSSSRKGTTRPYLKQQKCEREVLHFSIQK
jgi:hypothetical protein